MTAAGTRKPAVELLEHGVRLAEVPQRRVPGRRGPRRRALREVAEDGRRAGGAAAADRPQLHRGEVLRLVQDDVPEARRALEEVGDLVEQDGVGRASSGRAPGDRGRLPRAAAAARRRRGCRRRAAQERRRRRAAARAGVPGRPPARARRRSRATSPGAGHRVLHAVVGGVAGVLHLHQDRRAPAAAAASPGRRRSATPAVAQLLDDLARPRTRAPASGATRAAPRAPRWPADVRPHGAVQHLGHPGVALERGRRRRGRGRGRGTRPTQVLDRSSAGPRPRRGRAAPAPMCSRNERFGPTTSTPARLSRSRWA